jgi:hypothetical protein
MGANTTERVPVFQDNGLWRLAKNPNEPEIVLEVYPPVIINLHPESLAGIHAGRRPVSQVLETLQFMKEDYVIAPEHEYTGRNHRWDKRAGCHL